jgi:hypothetical protein
MIRQGRNNVASASSTSALGQIGNTARQDIEIGTIPLAQRGAGRLVVSSNRDVSFSSKGDMRPKASPLTVCERTWDVAFRDRMAPNETIRTLLLRMRRPDAMKIK